MKEINPAEMIEWFEGKSDEFKSKSDEFKKIAATLRAVFNAQGKPSIEDISRRNGTSAVTLESIKATLSDFGRAARFGRIAEALNADPETVREIITSHPNDFEMKGRGWWSAKSKA